VDHPPRGQPARRGGHRLAGGQAAAVGPGAQLAARGEDLRAATPVDGAVDPAAAEQRRVRRVDDGVCLLLGDVAELEYDPHAALPIGSPALRVH
jgi:hypothetical protein